MLSDLCLQVFGLNQVLPITGWLAAFALAWTAGLVVPAAPGGLGVFEAVLLLRLGQSVPEEQPWRLDDGRQSCAGASILPRMGRSMGLGNCAAGKRLEH